MPYSDFTIEKVKTAFNLTIDETKVLFPDFPLTQPSFLLNEWLRQYAPLATAINTEKARSEFLIAPVLAEVRSQLEGKVALFSGVDFTVDASAGLTGFCDFLFSASSEQLYIDAPVVAVVEAKNENIKAGLGQCIAEMVAAQTFNAQKAAASLEVASSEHFSGGDRNIETIYGVVTTGEIWKFLTLDVHTVVIDRQTFYIADIEKILGVFLLILGNGT